MIRLLLRNLWFRLRDWLRKPDPKNAPRWTLKEIAQVDDRPSLSERFWLEVLRQTDDPEAAVVAIIMGFGVFAILFAVILLAFTFWQLERKL